MKIIFPLIMSSLLFAQMLWAQSIPWELLKQNDPGTQKIVFDIFMIHHDNLSQADQSQLFHSKVNAMNLKHGEKQKVNSEFSQYRVYVSELNQKEASQQELATPIERWMLAKEIQNHWLSSQIQQGLLEDDNHYDYYMAQLMEVLEDSSISNEQKRFITENLRYSLPETMSHSLQDVTAHLRSLSPRSGDQSMFIQQDGAISGHQAARFEKLSKERTIWKSRLNEAKLKFQELKSADPLTFTKRFQDYVEQRFSAPEQRRLKTFINF